jgi:DNA replication protein DnaC
MAINRHEELCSMLHQLKLPAVARAFSELGLKAAREGLSHEAFLYELTRLECEQRTQRRVQQRLHQSKLPPDKTFGSFGKSHLMCAVGHELIQQGHSVLWLSTATLVQRLLAAKRDLRLPQELARLDRVECLMLDDIGYVQHDRDEMEVLFTLLCERYERKSVVITTNLVFSAWERIFKDPLTTMAAVDRVVHHSVILDLLSVESYRARQALQQQQPEKTKGPLKKETEPGSTQKERAPDRDQEQ